MPSATPDAEVIVIGLGAHGAAAAASLTRRGVQVIGLDQFELGHDRGSSHGRTRMIRRAYPNPVWNNFVDRAFSGWAALEDECDQVFLHRTGGLYAAPGQTHLQGPDIELVEDPARMSHLMPGFAVPSGHAAVYDPAAGVLEAARAIAALHHVARTRGADLRENVTVTGWASEDAGIRVHTSAGDLLGSRLVIAGGGWMGALVPELASSLEVWRILTLSVAPGQAEAAPPRLGAFSVDRPEGLIFGIPDADGNGLKIGVDAGAVWDPRVPVAAPTDDEVAELRALMGALVPGVDTTPAEVAACLYTMADDKRFTIGALARDERVVVSSSCSGHGFKFAPAIGEALADIATGIARPDLDFISTTRRGI